METPNQHSWQLLQRQSPAAIFVMLLRAAISLIRVFWPVFVGIFFKVNKSDDTNSFGLYAQWSVIIFSFLAIVYAAIEYFYYRFQVINNQFIIKSGWLNKKNISIPLDNIQGVHLQQSIWQRLFNVTGLKIDSPGTNQNEVSLDAIATAKAVELRQFLLSSTSTIQNESHIVSATNDKGWSLSIINLLKLSITANHLQAFFLIFAFGINIMDDLKRILNIDGWGAIESVSEKAKSNTLLAISILIGLVAIISVFVSGALTINKFYNFTILPVEKGWRIAHGLLKYQQRLIPYRKIQILSWHANWLRRKIGFWIVDIKIIGGNSLRRKEQLHITTTNIEQVLTLVPQYQQSPVADTSSGFLINDAYYKRKLYIIILPITIIAIAASAYWLHWHSAWITLFTSIIYIHVFIYAKTLRWNINAEGLQLYEGVWGRKFTLLKWQKVQQVIFVQSLYQQKNNLASLKFKTAGGNVSIPYIAEAHAQQIANEVMYLIEAKEINWQ